MSRRASHCSPKAYSVKGADAFCRISLHRKTLCAKQLRLCRVKCRESLRLLSEDFTLFACAIVSRKSQVIAPQAVANDYMSIRAWSGECYLVVFFDGGE